MYNLALTRGYEPKQAQPEGGEGGQQAPAGIPQGEAPKGGQQPNIDNIEKGVAASRSSSGGGSAPVNDSVTLKDLSEMPDDEFDKYWEKTVGKFV